MVTPQLPLAAVGQVAPLVAGVLAGDLGKRSAVEPSEPNAVWGDSLTCPLQTPDDSQRLALAEQLLREHYDRVYRYAFHMLGCRTSAEDIAQEVFLRAYSNAHQLRSLEAVVGWLLAITRNEVARWCSKWGLGQVQDFETAEDCRHEQQYEDRDWVHCAIQQLPLEFRRVVLMFYFEQKSYAEIAVELELPIGTVMSRLNRARGHLKASLNALSGTAAISDECDLVRKESNR